MKLLQYDYVAWHASDAVLPLEPAASDVRQYVARLIEGDSVWSVAFGRSSAARDTFYVAYEARQTPQKRDSFVVERHAPPRADTGYLARAARAAELGRTSFTSTEQRPYNVAVLPAPGGDFWVYLMPAQTRMDVYPLGGDVRYRVSGDGRRIVATRRMHNVIIEYRAPTSKDATIQAGTQSAVLDNIPEDTDVFHVMTRRPEVPQYIVTDAFIYRITPDGVIRLMGRREEILGK